MERNHQLKIMIGQRFGNLVVISRNPQNSKSGNARWDCKCDCGNKATVIGSKLRNGHTKSCGCARKSEVAQGYSKTRLYRIWRGMHNRCYKRITTIILTMEVEALKYVPIGILLLSLEIGHCLMDMLTTYLLIG